MSQKRFQVWNYKLNTLAPVHIGTGEEIAPLEYHLNKALIVPDIDKLFTKYPQAAEQFQQRLVQISSGDLTRTTLTKLLDARFLDDPAVWRYAIKNVLYTGGNNGKSFDPLRQLQREIEREQGRVKLATKTPDFRAYIPGSSLKGAFKTAWAYQQAKGKPILDQVSNLIVRGESQSRAEQVLMTKIFQPSEQRKEANYDLFRLLQIADTEPRRAADTLILLGERVLSAGVQARQTPREKDEAQAQYKNYWTFCEAIDTDQEFHGQVSFDEMLQHDSKADKLIGWRPDQKAFSIPTLCEAVNDFAWDICNWELDYFNHLPQNDRNFDIEDALMFYESRLEDLEKVPENTCYFSLGHGSGWHKLTIGMLLEQKLKAHQFADLRHNFNLAPRHTNFEFPKSRKLAMRDERCADGPLGWVKMEFTARG